MIIGHLAIAGIAKQTWFEQENLLFLSLAAFGPDLIDKPLNILIGLPGRGMSHSLIFFVMVIAAAFLLKGFLRFDSRTLMAGAIMWVSHLAGDFLEPQILFWPFLGHLPLSLKFHLLDKLWQFYLHRLYVAQFWMEIACVGVFLTLLLARLFTSWPRRQETL